jgi:hypothetical protein
MRPPVLDRQPALGGTQAGVGDGPSATPPPNYKQVHNAQSIESLFFAPFFVRLNRNLVRSAPALLK